MSLERRRMRISKRAGAGSYEAFRLTEVLGSIRQAAPAHQETRG